MLFADAWCGCEHARPNYNDMSFLLLGLTHDTSSPKTIRLGRGLLFLGTVSQKAALGGKCSNVVQTLAQHSHLFRKKTLV